MSDNTALQVTEKFSWRRRFGGDAQIVGETLNQIARQEGLALSSVPILAVIEHARNEDSPLHRYFEWDDTEAARKFRMHQARLLIGGIDFEVVRMGGEVAFTSPAYLVVPGSKNVYTPVSEAMADNKRRIAILNDARNSLLGWMRRFDVLQQIPGLDLQINAVVEYIDEYIMKQEGGAESDRPQIAA